MEVVDRATLRRELGPHSTEEPTLPSIGQSHEVFSFLARKEGVQERA